MKFLMTCGACGHQMQGDEGRELMNRIKLLSHIEKCHPERVARFREALRAHADRPIASIDTILAAA
ncbi:MAG: hypothetical protein WAN50_01055 [Minisyncoccia bacterium]